MDQTMYNVSSQQSAVSSQQSALTQRLSASRNSHSRLFSLKTILLTASFALVSACSGGGGGSEPAPKSDTKAPTVTKVEPDNGAEIAKNQTITVTFSENVKGVNNTNVSLTKSGSSNSADLTIAGSGKAYTIKPNADLDVGASYTLTLKKAIADTAGNKLAVDVSKTYTVSASSNPDPDPNPAGDTTAPTISSLSPAENATIGTASNKRPTITVTFSENVANVGDTNVKFKQGTTDLAITIGGSGKTYTITPNADLVASKPYTLEFKAGIKDAAGNALVAVSKNYTSGDLVAPTVSVTPANNSESVSIQPTIKLVFSEAVTGVTNSLSRVKLSKARDGSNAINLSRLSNTTTDYVYKPSVNLDYSTVYYIVIEAAEIKDSANNPLGSSDLVMSFKTSTQPISMKAWVGKTNSTISFAGGSLATGSQLYSYGNADCDIANISACTLGQGQNVSSASNITANALTLSKDAYFKVKNGTSTGSAVFASAEPFSARQKHQVVLFKNKLWIFGGENGARSVTNDVYSSEDGKNWKKEIISTTTVFSPRRQHQAVAFKNKLWIIGGESNTVNDLNNDVYSSEDGIVWKKETPTGTVFSARKAHQAVAFAGKLWVIAGNNGADQNDVYSSVDGIAWQKETITGDVFAPRSRHQVVVYNNKLWLIAGFSRYGRYKGVFSSVDGKQWVQELPDSNSVLDGYENHQVVVFNNQLLIIGGYTGSLSNEVFSSTDGKTWTNKSPSIGYTARQGHQAVVFKNKLWVIGGFIEKPTNTVYSSSNIDEWALESASSALHPVAGHQAVQFKGKFWAIGGENEEGQSQYTIFSSDDGLAWKKLTHKRTNRLPYQVSEHQLKVFNNKLWLIGGYNTRQAAKKVLSSADGTTWSFETTSHAFDNRQAHQVVEFNNKLWLFGGRPKGSSNTNDVYSSADGTTWVKQTPSVSSGSFPSELVLHQVVKSSFNGNNKLWILGGFHGGTNPTNDVYSSVDGINWTKETTTGGVFTARYSHRAVFFNNKLWVIGGADRSNSPLNDVYSSVDGKAWVKVTDTADFPPRFKHDALVANNALWVIGGETTHGIKKSDIWKSDDGINWRKAHIGELKNP